MTRFGRRTARLGAFSVLSAWMSAGCTFPDFNVPRSGVGGSGSAGNSSSGGSASAGAGAGTSGGNPSQAGNTTSLGGEGGEPGEPIPVDIGPCGQRRYAQHCWNGEKDDDESDVDCGGSRCAPCAAEEACKQDADCSLGPCESGSCRRSFWVEYVQDLADAESASFRLKALLHNDGQEPVLLRDLELRYYFSRNGVTEPILPGGSSFLFPAGTEASGETTYAIVRQLRGDDIDNDAYLAIGFTKSKVLMPGEWLSLDGSAISGDGSSRFNQLTHYSFDAETTLHESKKLTAHLKGERVWGRPPEVADPPSCFERGVNLDGAALTIDGASWQPSPSSLLDRYIEQGVAPYPDASDEFTEMLRAGFFFHDDSFTYPVDNGSYALVVYAWSAVGAETGRLRVDGRDADAFHGTSYLGASPWVGLGPYRVTVDDGQLELGASGDLRVGGFELRLLDE